MAKHPTIESLQRFADGLLPPDDMATVAIHVAGCDECRKRANGERLENQQDRETNSYAGAIRRIARKSTQRGARFNRDKRRAPSDLAKILALPTDEWNRAIRSSPRYLSYAFAQQALAASKAGWTDDPYLAERLAELGLFVADRLSNAEHGKRNLNDLRSRAWAYVGNCQRIYNDCSTSSTSFQQAVALHHAGSANGRERTKLISFLRSLVTDTCQHLEAFDLLDEIESRARHYKDHHELGRGLWARGKVHLEMSNADYAVPYLERSLRIFINHGDLLPSVNVRSSPANTLINSGSPKDGLRIFSAISSGDRLRLGTLDRIRLDWLEAMALWKLGNPSLAAAELTRCRQELKQNRIAGDASRVSLDLARVWLDLGENEQAADAAFAALPALALRGHGHLSLQALDLFRRAGGIS